MSICCGWGWKPPQTASPIQITHIQSVWAHWYAVHCQKVTALNNFTPPTWLIFWGSVSLVETKWCDYVMVRLTATSNCFTHVFELKLICCPLAYSSSLTQLYPHYLDQILRLWGHLWSQNDVITSSPIVPSPSSLLSSPFTPSASLLKLLIALKVQ